MSGHPHPIRSEFDVPEGSEYPLKVKNEKNMEEIARNEKSTGNIVLAVNNNKSNIRSGQEIRCQKGSIKRMIQSWRPITPENVGAYYNVGNMPLYVTKMKYVLNEYIYKAPTASWENWKKEFQKREPTAIAECEPKKKS